MADYKNIKGFNIQYLDSDPPNPIEGQMWFNSTTQTLKGAVAGIGSWSAGGDLNTLRNSIAGFGTPTAAVGAGGDTAPGARLTDTEEYNGTSWTSVNPLSGTGRQFGDATGTQTAGIMAGGLGPGPSPIQPRYYNFVETYDGTNWTEVAEINTGRYANATVGVQTDAITIGGGSPAVVANTEKWNGSSWTEVNDLNTVRQFMGSGGTTTSAIIAGGDASLPAYVANVETWNGTSWTETTDLNTARSFGTGSGSSDIAAVTFGGNNGTVYIGITESWNGTSWTEMGDLATARGYINTTKGSSTAALCIAGSAASRTLATEEFVLPDVTVQTVTTS